MSPNHMSERGSFAEGLGQSCQRRVSAMTMPPNAMLLSAKIRQNFRSMTVDGVSVAMLHSPVRAQAMNDTMPSAREKPPTPLWMLSRTGIFWPVLMSGILVMKYPAKGAPIARIKATNIA